MRYFFSLPLICIILCLSSCARYRTYVITDNGNIKRTTRNKILKEKHVKGFEFFTKDYFLYHSGVKISFTHADSALGITKSFPEFYEKRMRGERYVKEYHLFYPTDTTSNLDTNKLKSLASLLFHKAYKKLPSFLKNYKVVITSDSTGYFKLNTFGFRDRSANFWFNTKEGHMHYRYLESPGF